jgi:hypothetical protein
MSFAHPETMKILLSTLFFLANGADIAPETLYEYQDPGGKHRTTSRSAGRRLNPAPGLCDAASASQGKWDEETWD